MESRAKRLQGSGISRRVFATGNFEDEVVHRYRHLSLIPLFGFLGCALLCFVRTFHLTTPPAWVPHYLFESPLPLSAKSENDGDCGDDDNCHDDPKRRGVQYFHNGSGLFDSGSRPVTPHPTSLSRVSRETVCCGR